MIRFFCGLCCLILAVSAIDGPAELMNPETIADSTESWMIFTMFLAIGVPLMMWGMLVMEGQRDE